MSLPNDPDDIDLVRSKSGGIYPIRDAQYNARSFDKRSAKGSDVEVVNGSQKAEVEERDIRRKQVGSNWQSNFCEIGLTIRTGIQWLASVWVASHCHVLKTHHLTDVGLPTNLLASSTATSVQARFMCIHQPSPRTLLTMISWAPSLSSFGPLR